MSGDSYAAVWRTRWPNPYHFAVAMVLARYQDPEGYCGLKQKTLARIAACSPRQVQKVLQEMADVHQVEIMPTTRRDGSKGANRIRLTLAAIVDSKGDPLVSPSDFYSEYSAYGAPGSRTTSVGGDDSYAPGVTNEVRSNSKQDSSVSESLVSVPAAPDAQHAFDAYNERAKVLGLSIAEKLTPTRVKHLKRRIQESGIEGWARALAAIERSRFLMGETRAQGDRGPFKLTLDFLLQAKSFQKVIEGGFDDGRRPKVEAAAIAPAYQDRLRTDERFARTMAHQWTQDPDRWPTEAGPAPGQPGCVLPASIQLAVLKGEALEAFLARTGPKRTDGADALAYALAPTIGVDLGREHATDDEVPL